MLDLPYIYVSQDYLYLRQMVNTSSIMSPVSQFVFKFLGAQLLPVSSRNITSPQSLSWRRTIVDTQVNPPSLLHLAFDSGTSTYSIFQAPISVPDIIPNVTNQTDPTAFSFTYPTGITLKQSITQPKWMYLTMNPTGNSGGPLTTITGQIFSPGSPGNKITITDSEPGNWTILGGTDQTLDCAIAFDSTSSMIKTFFYNQTAQSGGIFADVTSILIGEGVTNPATVRLDVSNKCQFLSIGDKVYHYDGTNYNNITLPISWVNATFDDTYQIAIVNNQVYQFSSGSYVLVYTPLTPFYLYKMIYYQPARLLIYSYIQNGTFYPYKVHSLWWNGSNWCNINISLQGVSIGSYPGFATSPDFQSFGLGGIDVNLNPFIQGRVVQYSNLMSINVAIPVQMLYDNQTPYVKLSNNFMYYRRLPSTINATMNNHQVFYQIDKQNGILRFISKRNLTSMEQSSWRQTFINQVNGSMIVLYEVSSGQTINLIQRQIGNSNGNGSPAYNMITSDTGVINDGNKTYFCPAGCASCLSVSQCDSCADGFVFDSTTFSCLRCKGQCKSCTIADLATCTSCFIGTYLSSGSCALCSVSCLQCDVLSTNCTSCKAGLVLNVGVCSVCNDTNCITCSNAATCTVCRSGFVVNSTNQCVQCKATCTTCDPTNVLNCLACRSGFQLINGVCRPCPTHCDTCLNSVCATCRNGYKMSSSGVCVKKCMFPCLSCSDNVPNSCTGCSAQYFLSSSKCLPNSACNSTSSCPKCAMGFVLFNGVCYPCQAGTNCKQCDSTDSTLCTSCNTGYYLQSDSTCLPCPSSCISCDTYQTCTTCMPGYTLSGNLSSSQCIVCELPCQTCAQSPVNCLSCVGGYTLRGWKCVSKINVFFDLKLNTDYSTITTTILINILEALAQLLNLNSTQLITITVSYSGSTVLQGYISQSSANQAASSVNTLNSLSSGSSLGGVPIISSSFSSSQDTGSNTKSLAIILGVVIPVIIIIAVIVGYLIYKKRTNKIAQESEINEQKKPKQMSATLAQFKNDERQYQNIQEQTLQNIQQSNEDHKKPKEFIIE